MLQDLQNHCFRTKYLRKTILDDEKPTQSHFINAGIYVFDSQFLSLLSAGEKIDMPDLIRLGIDKDRKVTVFPIHEYWLDIGALPELSAARSELKDNSSDWL